MNVFFQDPWWLIAIKVLALFVILLLWTIFNVWYERRLVGKMQHFAVCLGDEDLCKTSMPGTFSHVVPTDAKACLIPATIWSPRSYMAVRKAF